MTLETDWLQDLFNTMDRQTDSSMLGTLRKVEAPARETNSMVGSLEGGSQDLMWQKWEFLLVPC